jgi:hypothetical protein
LRAGHGDEFYEHNAAAIDRHLTPALLGRFAGDGRGRSGNGFLDIGKAGDWRPGCAAIDGAPQAVVAGSKVQDVAVPRINRKALAIAAPILVAAEFQWHVCPLKALALVVGAEDGAVGRTRVGVSSAREVDPIGIG